MGVQKGPCMKAFIHTTTLCDHDFNNAYYMSVHKRRFRNIRMEIVDTFDKPILFNKYRKATVKVFLGFRHVWRAMNINTAWTSSTFIPNYGAACTYYLHQARRARGDNDLGPIYSNPYFLQCGHVFTSFFGGLSRSYVHPLQWQSAKAVGSEAIVRGRNIIAEMAQNTNHKAKILYIVRRNLTE